MALARFLNDPSRAGGKVCFVTIGATAGFDGLLRAVLSDTFLDALAQYQYTDLIIQYGKDEGGVYRDFQDVVQDGERTAGGVRIMGFGFNQVGLGQEMRAVKGGKDGKEGVVVSHAGSGSILGALRINVPVIVVPNPHLLDNHQVELAEQLAKLGYVTHGHLDDLAASLGELEDKRDRKNVWPPDNSRFDPKGKGVEGAMEDQLGLVDGRSLD